MKTHDQRTQSTNKTKQAQIYENISRDAVANTHCSVLDDASNDGNPSPVSETSATVGATDGGISLDAVDPPPHSQQASLAVLPVTMCAHQPHIKHRVSASS
mmetsp:Transcript_9596/g.14411  ORF Transcript_9596/g.14411 Transcript_9596/m.14411 type:complete len:101 (+) Transcript_9596:267-569(+)